VTGSCEYGDEPSGCGATELVTLHDEKLHYNVSIYVICYSQNIIRVMK
jgi:hypothetical protein